MAVIARYGRVCEGGKAAQAIVVKEKVRKIAGVPIPGASITIALQKKKKNQERTTSFMPDVEFTIWLPVNIIEDLARNLDEWAKRKTKAAK